MEEEETTPTPIDSGIVGKWVFKQGTITGFLTKAEFSQTIEFRKNGNFAETAYVKDLSLDANTTAALQISLGNWSGADGVVVLNDWDGVLYSENLYIQSVDERQLMVKYNGNELTFVRDSLAFNDLKEEIADTWYSITRNEKKSNLELKKDGTGSVTNYVRFSESYIATGGSLTWWIDGGVLVTHSDQSASGFNTEYQVAFINSKYLGLGNPDTGPITVKERQ